MRYYLKTSFHVVVIAGVLGVSGCGNDCEEGETGVLIVKPAEKQPASEDLGVLIVVQASEAYQLSMRTERGTHSGAFGSGFVTASCVDLSESQGLFYVAVRPEDAEALLVLTLHDKPVDDKDGCTGTSGQTVVYPVAVTVKNTEQESDAGMTTDAGEDKDAS